MSEIEIVTSLEKVLLKFGEVEPFENMEKLSINEVYIKIKSFMESDPDLFEDQGGYFLEALYRYPESLIKREMSEKLKRIITAFYVWGVLNPRESYEKDYNDWKNKKRVIKPDPKDSYYKPYFSYEYLAVCFVRSKASIHEAISKYRVEYEQKYRKVKDEYAEFQEWKKNQIEQKTKETYEQSNEQPLA